MAASKSSRQKAQSIAAGAGLAALVPEKKSVATQLVELAEEHYTFGCAPDGEAFAVSKTAPRLVRQLRGGRQSLRAELAKMYFSRAGAAPAQGSLADALAVLEGQAQTTAPVPLHLRVAEHSGRFYLDLGDETGRCVEITPGVGWTVVAEPPVMFRRTALTGPLPEPVSGGSFGQLWAALNVAERYRPLVLAGLVAGLVPNIPHPVTQFTGEQGTGKTTATARYTGVLDPSPAQTRKPPKDVEQWVTAAAGSWFVALDNLSGVSDWLSDALCRASTGDGDVRRRLYSDADLAVYAFRRCVVINGIDVGALRGDLTDRLVHLALERIPDRQRRLDEEMTQEWRDGHPRVLGALCDLAVEALGVLPSIRLEDPPRMADFARVLAAVDHVNGTDGMDVYLGLRSELAQDAATSDPILVALAARITTKFSGTAAELLNQLEPSRLEMATGGTWNLPRNWPTNARALTTALTRQAPTLRQLGWTIEKLDRSADPRGKSILWELSPPQTDPGEASDDTVTQNVVPFTQGRALRAGSPEADAVLSRLTGGSGSERTFAATSPGCGTDAAAFAAPSTHPLTRGNS